MEYDFSELEFDNFDYSNILKKDSKYDSRIYDIVVFFFNRLSEEMEIKTITAESLLVEFKDFLIATYGVMSPVVLCDFGVETSKDIGNIVRNLKKSGYLKEVEVLSEEEFDREFNLVAELRRLYD